MRWFSVQRDGDAELTLRTSSLYSAIADQVNTMQLTLDVSYLSLPELVAALTCACLQNRKETYSSVRSYASQYMRAHPDDFLPFLETPEDRLMTPGQLANEPTRRGFLALNRFHLSSRVRRLLPHGREDG